MNGTQFAHCLKMAKIAEHVYESVLPDLHLIPKVPGNRKTGFEKIDFFGYDIALNRKN
jgi:hypothetical protein